MKTELESLLKNMQDLFVELAKQYNLSQQQLLQMNKLQQEVIHMYNKLYPNQIPSYYPWETKEFIQTWTDWKRYQNQQFNFEYGEIAEQETLKYLQKLSEDNEQKAIEIIKNAIIQKWKNLYLPTVPKSTSKPPKESSYD